MGFRRRPYRAQDCLGRVFLAGSVPSGSVPSGSAPAWASYPGPSVRILRMGAGLGLAAELLGEELGVHGGGEQDILRAEPVGIG